MPTACGHLLSEQHTITIMDTKLLDEVIACLPQGKTHYRYHHGAFAPRLLRMLLPETASLHDIKQTRFKRLLDHPLVKPTVANCGGGQLVSDNLAPIWQEPSYPFLLSVSRWGACRDRSWYQTSRYGENLVLQLNMPVTHQRLYNRSISERGTLNGRWSGHPVQLPEGNKAFRETLAWSRIDIDFDTNEALIEEVQSDGARYVKRWAKRDRGCRCTVCCQRRRYLTWMQPYQSLWAETLLMATIDFIYQELGIERIFMHTARSGWRVKKMDKDWHAPRSLYSDLPKKFVFKQTFAAPEFLLRTRCYKQLIRKQPDIDFYQLSMHELKDMLGQKNQ